jgi:tRNA1Val (adenine37-N6)-methyltransferase
LSHTLSPGPDETLEPFGRGRLRLLQKKHGYRFSLDAVLLAGLAPLRPGERVIDLGTGCGIIPLLLACRREDFSLVGVECQPTLAELAEKNVCLNGFSSRIEILLADMRHLRQHFPPASFQVVLSNPPYRPLASGRLNPTVEKARARHELTGSLHTVTEAARYLLAPGGRLYLIYPAWRLVTLCASLRSQKIEPKGLRPIYSRAGESACLIWVEARRDSGEQLKLLDPLFIYGEDGEYTDEVKNLLDWG